VKALAPTPTTEAPLPLIAKAILAVEIVLVYARVRRLLARRGLEGTLTVLRTGGVVGKGSERPVLTGRRLGRAVVVALRPLPVDSRCLMRSLVLTRLLTRRGLSSSLVIGVRPAERFGAHAWVELDGRAILPVGPPSFERLVAV
jgi:hypothetical protein